MSKFRYFLLQLRSKLWLKPALTGIAAAGWVEAAYFGGNLIPARFPAEIGRDLLFNLLQILASSMLTVAIFAVSAMVAAFSSVATTATPRATRIVMQDRSAQNALAAFLSAFIYAIVSLVALSALSYGAIGRFLLFAGYVVIIVWVLVSFIRWVDQVSKLGRMSDTIRRVEDACRDAFTDPALSGCLGGCPPTNPDADGCRVFGTGIGYVQHIDMSALEDCANRLSTKIRLLVRPGAFIDRHRPLALIISQADVSGDDQKLVSAAFTIGNERHAESDPRCGLLILAEIADRALSPAVNDPGTAIAVIGTQIRLLSEWADTAAKEAAILYPNLEVSPLCAEDLLDDAFSPIARDGASQFEVGTRLQKAFLALRSLGHRQLAEASVLHSKLALEQALAKLPTEYHRKKLERIAREVESGSGIR